MVVLNAYVLVSHFSRKYAIDHFVTEPSLHPDFTKMHAIQTFQHTRNNLTSHLY